MKRKVLIVGQTPPPFGGQAVMIEQLLAKEYSALELHHVRMNFSKEMDEIGKFKVSKLFHLVVVIMRILYVRVRHRVEVLYYPPPGPNKVPFIRDVVILLSVRPWFKKTIFHFHASGLSELYPKLSGFFQYLFRKAYFFPDGGIRLSQYSHDDPGALFAKRNFLIPYGIPDSNNMSQPKAENPIVQILFVGVNSEQKGVLTLVNAATLLKNRGVDFKMVFIGKFESPEFHNIILEKMREHELQRHLSFVGVKVGDEKFQYFKQADIFCFPSFFDAESFPVVLLEACSFGLPIVATRWRGIPSIAREEENGLLVNIKQADQVADKLEILIMDKILRSKMGARSREIFEAEYRIDRFHRAIEDALLTV